MLKKKIITADKWLKLSVNKHTNEKSVSRGRHNLSRHLLNLRASSTTPAHVSVTSSSPTPLPAIGTKVLRVNFLNPESSLFFIPWWRLEKKWPITRGLTLNFALELVYRFLYKVTKITFLFYFKVYIYTRALAREILEDIANFFDYLVRVFTLSFAPERQRVLSVNLPRFSQVLIFILMVGILVAPIKWFDLKNSVTSHKSQILSYAQAAMDQFSLAGENLFAADYEHAFSDFSSANVSLAKAQLKIGQLNDELAGLIYRLPIISSKVDSAQKVIQAARLLADSGEVISASLSSTGATSSVSEFNLGVSIANLRQTINVALPKLVEAQALIESADLGDIDTLMIATDWKTVQSRMSDLVIVFSQTRDVLDVLHAMIPVSGDRTYLFAFQNYSELRPTGGFMGSLAFVKFSDGKLIDINIPGGGPYDFQGQLDIKIKPPQPLTLINSLWQLQDANWYFDFKTSAEKINWFLDHSGAEPVDGVIAVNPDLVIGLLKLTGPIDLPNYKKVISADNFIRETQEAVELEYDRIENRPKKFISDLTPILIDKLILLPPSDQYKILGLIIEQLQTKGVQVYMTDTELESRVSDLGWAGEVKPGYFDYLAIVRTNIGGGKSDAVTYEKVNEIVDVDEVGGITNTIYFEREHRGDPYDIFHKRNNISWTKFYVPLGSQLLDAVGFSGMSNYVFKPPHLNANNDASLISIEKIIEANGKFGITISEEFGKTVFAGWIDVAPGEKHEVMIQYKLPHTLPLLGDNSNLWHYDVYFQQQSGVKPLNFTSQLNLPKNLVLRWQESSANLSIQKNSIVFTSNWDNDEFYGVVLGHQPLE